MHESGQESEGPCPRVFATTHWSVVMAAGRDESAPARSALETLCRAYWYPIYVYVRRKGHSPHDAQDLTQEFLPNSSASTICGSPTATKANSARSSWRPWAISLLGN